VYKGTHGSLRVDTPQQKTPASPALAIETQGESLRGTTLLHTYRMLSLQGIACQSQ